MSTLPGNPHADEAKTMTHRAGEGAKAISVSESVICSMLAAQAAATLAVAHELRTATLVNARLHDCLIGDAPYDDLIAETRTRLGLGGDS